MKQAFLAALPMQYIPLLSETCHASGGSDIPPAKIPTVIPSSISLDPRPPTFPMLRSVVGSLPTL